MEIDYFCLNQKLLYFRPAGIRLGSKRVNTIFKFLIVNKDFLSSFSFSLLTNVFASGTGMSNSRSRKSSERPAKYFEIFLIKGLRNSLCGQDLPPNFLSLLLF